MANINNLVLESFSDTYNSKTPSGQTLVKSILGGVAGAYILQQILTNPIQLQSQLRDAIIPGTILGGAYGLGKINQHNANTNMNRIP